MVTSRRQKAVRHYMPGSCGRRKSCRQGNFNVVLELLLSHGGSLELNYKKLNYIVCYRTELFKQVINQFELFTVVTENDGRVMFYADWLIENITSKEKEEECAREDFAEGSKKYKIEFLGLWTGELSFTEQ